MSLVRFRKVMLVQLLQASGQCRTPFYGDASLSIVPIHVSTRFATRLRQRVIYPGVNKVLSIPRKSVCEPRDYGRRCFLRVTTRDIDALDNLVLFNSARTMDCLIVRIKKCFTRIIGEIITPVSRSATSFLSRLLCPSNRRLRSLQHHGLRARLSSLDCLNFTTCQDFL
jgi:hypothetical protein